MQKSEILCTRVGEMLDMLDCNSIAHGASPKAAELSLTDVLFNVR